MNSTPFVLGVNYWPRHKAMYWWEDFDAGEVRDEFALIRHLGLKIVRLFLLWDDFQPTPTAVDPQALAHLATVCDLAADQGLGLDVTFFTGHMSGPNWTPRWLHDSMMTRPLERALVTRGRPVSGWYGDAFGDPEALIAERIQIETVVRALHNHPAIWMWNLGNEPDLFSMPMTDALGRAWVRDHVQAIRAIDPVHPVTMGLHTDSLLKDVRLRVDQVFAETDIAVMHAYPMYQPWVRSPLDPDFVPFACALTAALCGKPVLMEEFGGCTASPGQASHVMHWETMGQHRSQFMASEEDLAAYYAAVLPNLVNSGATGALAWCFADYVPALWGKPPCDTAVHERSFGLVRPDGSLKPHAEVIRAFAATEPQVKPIPAWARFEVSPEVYYGDPRGNMEALFYTYLLRKEQAKA